jgi:hypothetical protein
MCQQQLLVQATQCRSGSRLDREDKVPKAEAPRSKDRLYKTYDVEMESMGCSIFARRLIDTVLRNNLWQFKNVRVLA